MDMTSCPAQTISSEFIPLSFQISHELIKSRILDHQTHDETEVHPIPTLAVIESRTIMRTITNRQVRDNLDKRGIRDLYNIQKRVFTEVQSGHDILLNTNASSGKTISVLLPIIDDIAEETKRLAHACQHQYSQALTAHFAAKLDFGVESN
jgi:ATP-dependent helicase YprA (DUF1998 family)